MGPGVLDGLIKLIKAWAINRVFVLNYIYSIIWIRNSFTDMYVLPFSEVLDWKKFSFRFHEHDLPSVPSYLSQVSRQRISEMQHQLRHVFQSHFSSIRAITETSLSILNSRIYPQNIKTHADWNKVPDVSVPSNPLFLPTLPPADHGFTAVILTYNRLDSLFLVITKVSGVA